MLITWSFLNFPPTPGIVVQIETAKSAEIYGSCKFSFFDMSNICILNVSGVIKQEIANLYQQQQQQQQQKDTVAHGPCF